jgi:KUP system potassium uptake protein
MLRNCAGVSAGTGYAPVGPMGIPLEQRCVGEPSLANGTPAATLAEGHDIGESQVRGVHGTRAHANRSPLPLLCLTAMGVVYGDIGTSPLYAIRECFFGPHGVPVTHDNVLGVLSLIVWALIIVVTLKYHVYVLRADNHGEGGILALMSLARSEQHRGARSGILVALGLFGAALLYGDGMLTPAISVLSAIEGLEVATPVFAPFVVPLTVVILIGLFCFQRRGTAGVGAVFGPVILVWFLTLAVLGVVNIIRDPSVLSAVNPVHALTFLWTKGITGYLVLGAVFLVATGGEALYADLGHFGEPPIQIDWFTVVGPSLLLNYFGQGALLLHDPAAAHNPFYRLAPSWALYPLVILAAMATVIASQAVISGVFSLTRQAVQLGFAPRVDIVHTSSREIGQIYIPGANWGLMLGTLGLVLIFQNSSNLAAAYGVAVTTTMIITTLLAFVVARHLWRWSLPVALAVTGGFLVADLAFFGANIVKVTQGGWFPLLVGIAGFLLFTTWHKGRELLAAEMRKTALPLTAFVQDLQQHPVTRVPGTAVFLNSSPHGTPIALLHNLKLNRILHAENIIVTVLTEEVPYVSPEERLELGHLGAGFSRLIVRYGFMEDPDVPAALVAAQSLGVDVDPAQAAYILSNNTLIPAHRPGVSIVSSGRRRLFAFLSRNALRPTQFFRLPTNRVVELGMQITI